MLHNQIMALIQIQRWIIDREMKLDVSKRKLQ